MIFWFFLEFSCTVCLTWWLIELLGGLYCCGVVLDPLFWAWILTFSTLSNVGF